jgi:hypothetical protein
MEKSPETMRDATMSKLIQNIFRGGRVSLFSFSAMSPSNIADMRTPRAITIVFTVSNAMYGEGQKMIGASITETKNM